MLCDYILRLTPCQPFVWGRVGRMNEHMLSNAERLQGSSLIAEAVEAHACHSGGENRGAFLWLPQHQYSNDLEQGMVWMVLASLVSMLLPASALFLDFGEERTTSKDTMYVCVAVAGLFFTLGSWGVKRGVTNPQPKALFKCFHCSTDELFGMWCYTLGTFMAVPVLIVYISHYPNRMDYIVELVMAIFFVAVCIILTYLCYPRQEVYQDVFAPLFHKYVLCVGTAAVYIRSSSSGDGAESTSRLSSIDSSYNRSNSIVYHTQNDLLLASWTFLVGCASSTLASLAVTIYMIIAGDEAGIFEASGTFVNMLLFTLGALYFTAGSYMPRKARWAEEDTKRIAAGSSSSSSSNLGALVNGITPASPTTTAFVPSDKKRPTVEM